jgi:hypothetical protein
MMQRIEDHLFRRVTARLPHNHSLLQAENAMNENSSHCKIRFLLHACEVP